MIPLPCHPSMVILVFYLTQNRAPNETKNPLCMENVNTKVANANIDERQYSIAFKSKDDHEKAYSAALMASSHWRTQNTEFLLQPKHFKASYYFVCIGKKANILSLLILLRHATVLLSDTTVSGTSTFDERGLKDLGPSRGRPCNMQINTEHYTGFTENIDVEAHVLSAFKCVLGSDPENAIDFMPI